MWRVAITEKRGGLRDLINFVLTLINEIRTCRW